MVFGERIKALRIKNGWTQEFVCKQLNISGGALSRYETGMYEPKSLELVKDFASLFGVSTDYLLGKSDDKNLKANNVMPLPDNPVKVPVIGKISAGLPLLAEENLEGYEFAPSSLIKDGYEYFYLRVNGDSMNLKFNSGDIVLVQKQDDLENDEIGVILVDGQDATVKKYKYENGIVLLLPMSNNPEHVVQMYNPKDINIKIIGKVISYQGKV